MTRISYYLLSFWLLTRLFQNYLDFYQDAQHMLQLPAQLCLIVGPFTELNGGHVVIFRHALGISEETRQWWNFMTLGR